MPLSHSQGTPGASAVISLSTSAHALARWVGSMIGASRFMVALIDFTFSCGQLELLTGTMFSPLNVGSSIDSGSGKSFCHPVLGQIGTFCLGTLQNFVYIESWVTNRGVILNPSAPSCACTTWAASLVGPLLSATIRKLWPPVYRPDGYPALRM